MCTGFSVVFMTFYMYMYVCIVNDVLHIKYFNTITDIKQKLLLIMHSLLWTQALWLLCG